MMPGDNTSLFSYVHVIESFVTLAKVSHSHSMFLHQHLSSYEYVSCTRVISFMEIMMVILDSRWEHKRILNEKYE